MCLKFHFLLDSKNAHSHASVTKMTGDEGETTEKKETAITF